MKNKVWENPTITALNAKETMEDMEEKGIIDCIMPGKPVTPNLKPGEDTIGGINPKRS